MEDEAAKEDFEALDDIEDIEAPGEGGAGCLLYTSPSPRDS